MSKASDLRIAGRFDESIAAYEVDLLQTPDDIGAIAGLASSLMAVGRYAEAIPLKWRTHEIDQKTPGTCGQLHHLACCYWCIGDRARGIELAHELVAGVRSRRITMAPDQAGGCSFGFLLLYMAMASENESERAYAMSFLEWLRERYKKNKYSYGFPKLSVEQMFDAASFDDVLLSGTKQKSLEAALDEAQYDRAVAMFLSTVLFNDAIIRRTRDDDAGAAQRLQQLLSIGYWAESVPRYLVRNELEAVSRP